MNTPEEWRPLLLRCSQSFLADTEKSGQYPVEVRESGWLGYEPATEEALRGAEMRLGVILPPSLRAFYQISNGWRNVGPCIWSVPPVERLSWLKKHNCDLWELCVNASGRYPWPDPEAEDEYEQEQAVWVVRSLAVSASGDASTWLLDPGRVNVEGEWAAGRWSSWNPAMEWLTDSFAALFIEEFMHYAEWRDEP